MADGVAVVRGADTAERKIAIERSGIAARNFQCRRACSWVASRSSASKLEETELVVPYSAQRLAHQIHERTTVLTEAHDDTGTRFVVRAPARVLEDLRASIVAAAE